mgnify:FL=1
MPLPTPSIADAPRRVDYTPNNSAGPFPVPFPVFEGTGDDLAVTLDGVPVTNWTFAGDQIEGFYGSPGCWVNGTITFDAPITGALRIVGRRRPRRVDQFAEGRGVPARDHNLELNRLTAAQREIFDRVEEVAAVTADIVPEVTALKDQAQQAASDAAAAADTAEDAATAAEAAAQLLATHVLPDGTDFNVLDQRGTYILTSETNAPLPGPTNRWVVEVVADPADADRVVQRASLLVGGTKLELANRRRLAGATWEPWRLGAGQAVDVGYDDSTAFPGATNVQEALEAAADPWAVQPIGVPIPVFDHIPGVTPPPTDRSYRYIKLSAGEAGAGGYNEGVLMGEAVEGSAPLIYAAAFIDLPSSPVHGQAVRLINTERRFIRAGSSGGIQDDAFQSHLHGPPPGVTGYVTWQSNSLGSGGSVVMGVHNNTGGPVEQSGFGAPRVTNETRPRNIGATYFMRIL